MKKQQLFCYFLCVFLVFGKEEEFCEADKCKDSTKSKHFTLEVAGVAGSKPTWNISKFFILLAKNENIFFTFIEVWKRIKKQRLSYA